MVAVRQVKNPRPVDRLTRAPGFPRPVQGVAIAARLCRPDVFSMTSGIEVRDGGLPRRPGARRQGHGGRKVIIAPDGGDAWAPAKPRPDETLIRALARAHRWKRMLEEDGTDRLGNWPKRMASPGASSTGCSV